MARLWICMGYTGCLICLNMLAYTWKTECWLYLISEYIWCSTGHKVTVQITEQLSRQKCIQNTVKHWRLSVLQKENALMQLCNQNFFRAGEVLELGYFDKHFVKNTQKSALAGKDFRFFFLDALKTTFWKENLTQSWGNNRGGLPSPPREAAVIVVEYASISLNIPSYPWKCLNKLFWLNLLHFYENVL